MIGSKERTGQDSVAFLKALGLPTHKDDAWKYSDLSRFSFADFSPNTRLKNPVLPPALQSLVSHPEDALQMTFYNGQLVDCSELLTQMNIKTQDSTGAVLTIPENYQVEKPIFVVHIIDADLLPTWITLKNQIVLKASSSAKIVERFITLGPANSFSHITSKIEVGEQANLTHIYCQESIASHSIAQNRFMVGQIDVATGLHSEYMGTAITLGGSLNRVAFQIEAKGSYSNTQFYSLQMPKDNQHMDMHLIMRHQASQFSESLIVARGVVDNQARGAFTGKIVIDAGAHQTNAALENKNLLLSGTAEMNTRPQLEVYSDDVQHCSHGATVGHLDQDALFYLKSRGIPENEATDMLIEAFITPSLQGIPADLMPFVEGLLHDQ